MGRWEKLGAKWPEGSAKTAKLRVARVANHHSSAQIRRDHGNDKTLHGAGWMGLRYTTDQLPADPEGVRDEITRELTRRARRERAV